MISTFQIGSKIKNNYLEISNEFYSKLLNLPPFIHERLMESQGCNYFSELSQEKLMKFYNNFETLAQEELKKSIKALFIDLPQDILKVLETPTIYLMDNSNDVNTLINVYHAIKTILDNYIDSEFTNKFPESEIKFLIDYCGFTIQNDSDFDPFAIGLRPKAKMDAKYFFETQKEGETVLVFDLDGSKIKTMNAWCQAMAKMIGQEGYARVLGDAFIRLFNKNIVDLAGEIQTQFPDVEISCIHSGGDESQLYIKGVGIKEKITSEFIQNSLNEKLSKFKWSKDEIPFECRVDGCISFEYGDESAEVQKKHIAAYGIPLTSAEFKEYQKKGEYYDFINSRLKHKKHETVKTENLKAMSFQRLKAYMLVLTSYDSREFQDFLTFFGPDTQGEIFAAKRVLFEQKRMIYVGNFIKEQTISNKDLKNQMAFKIPTCLISSSNALKVFNSATYPGGNLTIELNALMMIRRFFRSVVGAPEDVINSINISNWRAKLGQHKGGVIPDVLGIDIVKSGLDLGLSIYKKKQINSKCKYQEGEVIKFCDLVKKEMTGTESVNISTHTELRHDFSFEVEIFEGKHEKYSTEEGFRAMEDDLQLRNNVRYMSTFIHRINSMNADDLIEMNQTIKKGEKYEIQSGKLNNIRAVSAHFEPWNNRSDANIDAISVVLFETLIKYGLITRTGVKKTGFSDIKSILRGLKIRSALDVQNSLGIVLFANAIVSAIIERGINTSNTRRLIRVFGELKKDIIEEVSPNIARSIYDNVIFCSGGYVEDMRAFKLIPLVDFVSPVPSLAV